MTSDERQAPSPEFLAEVLRINDRFTQEIVETYNVCPFARGARVAGTAIREVLFDTTTDPDPSLALLERLESDPRGLEVVQVIYPRLSVTPREFEHFNARLRDAHAKRIAGRAVFVHAVFHPDFPCDRRSPDALVSFFRRAPDPTIQLVRFETIESVRRDRHRGTQVYDPETFDWSQVGKSRPPSVPEKITRDNFALVERIGPDEIEAIQVSIRKDRDASYARFV
jgi:hypothetical protein